MAMDAARQGEGIYNYNPCILNSCHPHDGTRKGHVHLQALSILNERNRIMIQCRARGRGMYRLQSARPARMLYRCERTQRLGACLGVCGFASSAFACSAARHSSATVRNSLTSGWLMTISLRHALLNNLISLFTISESLMPMLCCTMIMLRSSMVSVSPSWLVPCFNPMEYEVVPKATASCCASSPAVFEYVCKRKTTDPAKFLPTHASPSCSHVITRSRCRIICVNKYAASANTISMEGNGITLAAMSGFHPTK